MRSRLVLADPRAHSIFRELVGLNIVELFYLRLFQEKIRKKTPHHAKMYFDLMNTTHYFEMAEIIEKIQKPKESIKIVNQLIRSGLVEKEGSLIKIKNIESLVL